MTLIKRFGSALLLASTLLCTPSVAQAQSAPTTRATMTPLPNLVGRRVAVIYRDGRRVCCWDVKKQDADTITLGSRPPEPSSDILAFDVKDREIDGGVKGFLVGAGMGLAATKGQSKAVPIVTGLVGSWLGLFFDGSRTVWERVPVDRPVRLTVMPTATLHSLNVNGTVRW